MAHTLKIQVERDLCIGSGDCVRIAPGVFELDDEDISTVVDPQAADEETIRRAERSCPVGAITVTDD